MGCGWAPVGGVNGMSMGTGSSVRVWCGLHGHHVPPSQHRTFENDGKEHRNSGERPTSAPERCCRHGHRWRYVRFVRILVVEDETGLAKALRIGLAREGHAVDIVGTVADATEALAGIEYDLLVLDLTLPDGDGVDLCRGLRSGEVTAMAGPNVPVLMLTARDALDDRVTGLDSGADDYLAKPFALAELKARIRAVLRRPPTQVPALLRAGDISVDPTRHLARRGTRTLSLTNKEFGVLEYLARHPGVVVSAEELLEHVWDAHADPFTQTVRVTVGTLRRKLTVAGEQPVLETVIGRGYRLVES